MKNVIALKDRRDLVETRFIALIRGINVGRAKRVAMADLRELVEELGYRNVLTVLNSGNVVFTATGDSAVHPASRIEVALSTKLGVSAKVIVITAEELATVVENNVLGEVASDPSRLLVAFLSDLKDRTLLESLPDEDWKPESLALGSGVAYLWCPDGVLASRVAKALNRVLGDRTTTRNWATVLKIHGKI